MDEANRSDSFGGNHSHGFVINLIHVFFDFSFAIIAWHKDGFIVSGVTLESHMSHDAFDFIFAAAFFRPSIASLEKPTPAIPVRS